MNYSIEISTGEPVKMDIGPDSNIVKIQKGAPVQPKSHSRFPKDYQSKDVMICILHNYVILFLLLLQEDDEPSDRRGRALHRLTEEVGVIRRSFKKAIHIVADQDQSLRDKRSLRRMKKVDDEMVDELVSRMKNMDVVLVRKMRAGNFSVKYRCLLKNQEKIVKVL